MCTWSSAGSIAASDPVDERNSASASADSRTELKPTGPFRLFAETRTGLVGMDWQGRHRFSRTSPNAVVHLFGKPWSPVQNRPHEHAYDRAVHGGAQEGGRDMGRRTGAARALCIDAGFSVARIEWARNSDGQLLSDRRQRTTADVVFRDRTLNPFLTTSSAKRTECLSSHSEDAPGSYGLA